MFSSSSHLRGNPTQYMLKAKIAKNEQETSAKAVDKPGHVYFRTTKKYKTYGDTAQGKSIKSLHFPNNTYTAKREDTIALTHSNIILTNMILFRGSILIP